MLQNFIQETSCSTLFLFYVSQTIIILDKKTRKSVFRGNKIVQRNVIKECLLITPLRQSSSAFIIYWIVIKRLNNYISFSFLLNLENSLSEKNIWTLEMSNICITSTFYMEHPVYELSVLKRIFSQFQKYIPGVPIFG